MSAAIPSASAGGCINVVHTSDVSQSDLDVALADDGVGVVVTAGGQQIGVIVLTDECHVTDFVGRYAAQATDSLPKGIPHIQVLP